jgi:hypothetical protein
LGLVGALGGGYALAQNDQAQTRPVPAGGIEELRKKIGELELQVQGPAFGSIDWAKSMAKNFLLSPLFLTLVVQGAHALGQKLARAVFYAPTLLWYVNDHTKLGTITLIDTSKDTMLGKNFVFGPLARELQHSVALLDGTAKNSVPVDYEYHKNGIINNFNSIVSELSGVVSFLQYKSTAGQANSRLSQEAYARARYLFNFTNNTCALLEKVLGSSPDTSAKKQPVSPIMQEFFSELEQVLVGFVRLEQATA